jgi:anti-anti-sigma regulatory factor
MLEPEDKADFYGGCSPAAPTFIEEDNSDLQLLCGPMTQSVQTLTIDRETLELRMLRLPSTIDSPNMTQIMAELEALLEPGIGVMLDFSRTHAIDPTCLKVFEFANQLANERSATLGYMGETDEIRTFLLSNQFFRDSSSHS